MFFLSIRKSYLKTKKYNMSFIAAAIVGGVGIAGKVGMGLAQGRKAKRIEQQNPFQKEAMSSYLSLNLKQAEMRANQGLPQAQYNQATQGIGRGTSTYLRAFGRSGRAGGLMSAIRAQNDALLGLNVADANAVNQNQNRLAQQRSVMAGEEARLFNNNIRRPYEEARGRAAAARAASSANIGGAFSDLTSLGAMAATSGLGGGSGVSGVTGSQLLGLPAGRGFGAYSTPKYLTKIGR